MDKPLIYFRADGNSFLGLGHLFRSLSLAQNLQDLFNPVFLVRSPDLAIQKLISDFSFKLINLNEKPLLEEAREFVQTIPEGSILTLDGYHFSGEYQKILKQKFKLVCVDDFQSNHYFADVVINHAEGISPDTYSKEEKTELFLGFKYAILRKEFLEASIRRKHKTVIENAFICFGGADPFNLTYKFTNFFIDTDFKAINIVIGSAYQQRKSLEEFESKNMNLKINIYRNLSAVDLVKILESSDLAVTPSSTIALEACAVGIGLACGYYVKNQLQLYCGLRDNNAIFDLGNMMEVTKQQFRDKLKEIVNVTHVNTLIDKQCSKLDGQSGYRLRAIYDLLMNQISP